MTNDINKYIQELTTCLTNQDNLIQQLITTAQNQVSALEVDDISELNNTSAKQEQLGRELALQEKRRRELVHKLETLTGKDKLKMTDIIKLAPSEEQQNLQKLTDNLIKNQIKLQEAHELSRLLLQQSFQYVQKLMDSLDPNRQKIYGSTGQVESIETTNALNRSI